MRRADRRAGLSLAAGRLLGDLGVVVGHLDSTAGFVGSGCVDIVNAIDVGHVGLVIGGHGTNSTFDILIWPPSRCRSTDSRHERGSCSAPAVLVTREDADTRTVAVSSVIDSTAVALTVTSVMTFESWATLTKSVA